MTKFSLLIYATILLYILIHLHNNYILYLFCVFKKFQQQHCQKRIQVYTDHRKWLKTLRYACQASSCKDLTAVFNVPSAFFYFIYTFIPGHLCMGVLYMLTIACFVALNVGEKHKWKLSWCAKAFRTPENACKLHERFSMFCIVNTLLCINLTYFLQCGHI